MTTRNVLLLVACLAGCQKYQKTDAAASHDSAGPATPAPAPVAATGAGIESTTFAPELKVDLAGSTKAPAGFYYKDLVVGTGTEVVKGRPVSVHYAGWLPNGQLFDQSGANDPVLTFTPGAGGVIGGWEEGLIGMKAGGKRQLILPPELGYGAGGNGPIPPNAVLVFTIEVVSVQ